MSVSLCKELDNINWLEARKQLEISAGAVHLLRYIAWRQGDGINGRVYLSQKQWLVHTGHSKSQFYEYLGELTSKGLVIRLTRGSNINSTRANYKVSEQRITLLPRIVLYTGQTNNSEVLNKEQDSPVLKTTLSAIPEAKRHKLLKTTVAFDDNIFNELVVSSIPHELRGNLRNGKELDSLLKELIDTGYSNQQIKDKLNLAYWQGIHTAYPHVIRFLTDLKKDKPRLVKALEQVDTETLDSERKPMPPEISAQLSGLWSKPE